MNIANDHIWKIWGWYDINRNKYLDRINYEEAKIWGKPSQNIIDESWSEIDRLKDERDSMFILAILAGAMRKGIQSESK